MPATAFTSPTVSPVNCKHPVNKYNKYIFIKLRVMCSAAKAMMSVAAEEVDSIKQSFKGPPSLPYTNIYLKNTFV